MNKKIKILITKFKENKVLIHFEFNTQKEMNQHFKRFSEYIECPDLKGTLFSKKDIDEYYKKEKCDYDATVLGHNIPGNKLKQFMKDYKKIETEEELFIIDKLKKYTNMDNLYIIATYKTNNNNCDALDHEIAHGMFYLIPEYKKKILGEMYKAKKTYGINYFNNIEEILVHKGYDSDVWDDEKHAFLVDLGLGSKGFFYGYTFRKFLKQFWNGKIRFHFKYKELGKKLAKIYLEYKKEK